MKQSQQAKLGEKTEYRKSVEYLAWIATQIEKGSLIGEFIYDSNSQELAKHIRKVLHGARG